MSIVMEIIENMIFDQSKASEAAQRCRFHPEVRPPVAANRSMTTNSRWLAVLINDHVRLRDRSGTRSVCESFQPALAFAEDRHLPQHAVSDLSLIHISEPTRPY